MFVKLLKNSLIKNYCGERGIRTLDTLLRYTHFPGVRLRPLGHFSLKIPQNSGAQNTKK
jgi:hypothetical protein